MLQKEADSTIGTYPDGDEWAVRGMGKEKGPTEHRKRQRQKPEARAQSGR